jgi:hypothetical protein
MGFLRFYKEFFCAFLLVAVGYKANSSEEIGSTSEVDYKESNYCSSEKWQALPESLINKWDVVEDGRIIDSSYYGKVFEASSEVGEQKLYLYKLMLSIDGRDVYESIFAFDSRLINVDVEGIGRTASYNIRLEAEEAVRRLGHVPDNLIVEDARSHISSWSSGNREFFTFEGYYGYLITEVQRDGLVYICSRSLQRI